ncbi:MAG: acyltransferase family protein [Oscillospiraceae bacterium]|nr:acyltransferase family protein [Oscillospiraceae bacterium]
MKQRRSNLELMRLLAMVLIIAHHFSVHSGFAFQGGPVTGNMLFLQLLSIGGKIGVNLFVMLSSWFLVESRQLNKAKLVMLWGQLVFYSLTIYLLSCLGGLAEFSLWELVRAAVPVLSKQWWFASSYVFLYLLHPPVNRLLAKKWFGGLLLILSVFWFGIPVLAWLPERLRDLAWFLYLYGITGYLRLHRKSSQGTSRRWFCLGLGCFLPTFALSVLGLLARVKSGAVFETVYFDAHHEVHLRCCHRRYLHERVEQLPVAFDRPAVR